MIINSYATCVKLKNKGILIFGDSGSGKSDLALRLIYRHKATLVADDRVNLRSEKGKLIASAPKILKNLLEVRGLGIIKMKRTVEQLLAGIELCEKQKDDG